MSELVGLTSHEAVFLNDSQIQNFSDLRPQTRYEFLGHELVTLPDIGDLRAVVATVNDVHFGEVECGKIVGVTETSLGVGPGEPPYPETMNASVIHDIEQRRPDLVVAKGDLTSFGTLAEYESFLQYYQGAFGERLLHVRGNHDSYPGENFADWPVQIRDVDGLRIVVLDTARAGLTGGQVSGEQRAAVSEAAHTSSTTVMVMGHHPLFVPDVDDVRRFDGVDPADSDALIEVLVQHENVVAYTAGHTHRNRRLFRSGVSLIEVACVKDFPGAWAEYRVGTLGISQTVHRASSADALAWSEKTRTMFDGYYEHYANGEMSDRCFVLPLVRK
ncbi:MAG: metallophosphoesterase [Actinomycetota bacterium]|jgi:hypothetical protein